MRIETSLVWLMSVSPAQETLPGIWWPVSKDMSVPAHSPASSEAGLLFSATSHLQGSKLSQPCPLVASSTEKWLDFKGLWTRACREEQWVSHSGRTLLPFSGIQGHCTA